MLLDRELTRHNRSPRTGPHALSKVPHHQLILVTMGVWNVQKSELDCLVTANSFSFRVLKSSARSRINSLPSYRAHKASSFRWQLGVRHSVQPIHLRLTDKSRCSISDQSSAADDILHEQDTNRLTTALNTAINAEDYKLAAQIRDRLTELAGSDSEATADWTKLGIPLWLAERAERLGYRFPTGDASQPCMKYTMQIRLL